MRLFIWMGLMLGGAPALANPLAKATQETLQTTGVVTERLPAGGYTYLHIQSAAQPMWLATMGTGAAIGERVTVQSFARANDFQSRRLKRRFVVLHFGTVTPL